LNQQHISSLWQNQPPLAAFFIIRRSLPSCKSAFVNSGQHSRCTAHQRWLGDHVPVSWFRRAGTVPPHALPLIALRLQLRSSNVLMAAPQQSRGCACWHCENRCASFYRRCLRGAGGGLGTSWRLAYTRLRAARLRAHQAKLGVARRGAIAWRAASLTARRGFRAAFRHFADYVAVAGAAWWHDSPTVQPGRTDSIDIVPRAHRTRC